MKPVSTPTSDVGASYRLEHPRLRDMLADLRIPRSDPGPGDQLPAFDLPTTAGGRFSRSQFDGTGLPVVLVLGSLTCPITESAAPDLATLHRRHGDRVRFVMVNVREAHPGELAPQTPDFAEKAQRAAELKLHHDFRFEVAIDDIDGSLHRWFGTRPSPAYLIDPHGTLVFRAHWSNATKAIDRALESVMACQRPRKAVVTGTACASMRMLGSAGPALDRGGRTAWRDLWKGAAPLALIIAVSNKLTFLPERRRGPAALVLAALAAIGVSSGIAFAG